MTSDAQIVIGIKGQTEGGKRVRRTLDDVTRSGDRATKATGRLDKQIKTTNNSAKIFGRTLNLLAAGFAVRALGRISDEFTVLDTSLRNVTDSTQEYDRVFASLFKTAQDNGDIFSGLVSTYQKLNVSLEESVRRSTDLTKVTELLSRGFAASGTNAQTAAGASLQLTQGLATNFKAAGQELNSIIEGAPLLAKVIAIELGGKGATDLKKFAEQGTLTAQSFLDALIASEDAIKEFAIPPTIGRSIQRVSNEFLRLVGQSEGMRSAAETLATAIDGLAKNLNVVFKVLAVGFAAFGGYMLATRGLAAAVWLMNGAVAAFNAILLANPLGLFIAAVAAVSIAAFVFRDDIEKAMIQPIVELIIIMDEALVKLRDFLSFVPRGIAALSIGVQEKLGIIDSDVAQAALLAAGEGANTIFDPEALRAGAASRVAALRGGGGGPGAFVPQGGGATGGVANIKAMEQAQKDLKKVIKDTRSEQEALLLRIKDLNNLKTFANTTQEVEALDRALEIANEQLLTASTAIPGLETAFDRLTDGVDDFADSTADAFADFVTGTSSAKDALRGLLNDLARAAAKSAVSGPLKGLLGSAVGALGGFFGGGGVTASSFAATQTANIGSGLFGPGFATGGSLTIGGNSGTDQNQLSLNGAPIARVSQGEVLNIDRNKSSSGRQTIINQTINVTTGVQETVRSEIIQLLPEIQRSTKAAIQEDDLRGISS